MTTEHGDTSPLRPIQRPGVVGAVDAAARGAPAIHPPPPLPARPVPIVTRPRRLLRIVMACGLMLLGLWILQDFLPAFAWAAIFAIAMWPLYKRLLYSIGMGRHVAAPAAITGLIALVFVIPAIWVAIEIAREGYVAAQFIMRAQHEGIPVPGWVNTLPVGGSQAAEWWQGNLADPQGATELFGRINTRELGQMGRTAAGHIVHGLAVFGFMLLTLFFLFRDGTVLTRQLLDLSDKLIGPRGERVASHMIAAVHGTVSGLVLVGLGEGVLLGIAYYFAGVPHAVTFGALTGVLAIIPFGAPVVFGAAALFLVAQGSTVAAAIVFGWGFLIVFVADHFVRPVLIGGAVRLPFLWVLLGILGGVHTLGLIGLFVGPAVMAALMSLWREWTESGETVPAPQKA